MLSFEGILGGGVIGSGMKGGELVKRGWNEPGSCVFFFGRGTDDGWMDGGGRSERAAAFRAVRRLIRDGQSDIGASFSGGRKR